MVKIPLETLASFLTNTELTEDERSKLEHLFDQADLDERLGDADSQISTGEWQALKSSDDYSALLDQMFGYGNAESSLQFTQKINALFRPQPAGTVAAALHEEAFSIPPSFNEMSQEEVSAFVDRQVELLRDDNLEPSDRFAQAQALVYQLKADGYYLEAAHVYEKLATLGAREGVPELQAEMQQTASFWRYFDETQSPELSTLGALKEQLQQNIDSTNFYPAKTLLEAQLAYLNHDLVGAKNCSRISSGRRIASRPI